MDEMLAVITLIGVAGVALVGVHGDTKLAIVLAIIVIIIAVVQLSSILM